MASEDRGPRVLGVTIGLWLLGWITVGLRFLSRRLSRAGIWWDDWTALSAPIFNTPMTALQIQAVKKGFGRHVSEVGAAAVTNYLKVLWVEEILYALVLSAAKLSIVLFYWRIFNGSSATRELRWSMYFLIFLVVGWGIGVIITTLVECTPIEAAWRPEKGTCIDMRLFFLGSGIPNAITDFLILVLPLSQILKLEMPMLAKLALTLAFALGSGTLIVSVVRVIVLVNFDQTADVTWDWVGINIWTVTEFSLAIISANLPSLGPLVRLLRARLDRRDTSYATRLSSRPVSHVRGRDSAGTVQLRNLEAGPHESVRRKGARESAGVVPAAAGNEGGAGKRD